MTSWITFEKGRYVDVPGVPNLKLMYTGPIGMFRTTAGRDVEIIQLTVAAGQEVKNLTFALANVANCWTVDGEDTLNIPIQVTGILKFHVAFCSFALLRLEQV